MMKAKTLSDMWWLIIFSVVLILIPVFVGFNEYYTLLATVVLIYGVITTAWNIMGGIAGQLDLGATAYLGLGAFTAGTFLLRWNISPWIGMFIGAIVASGFAFAIGYIMFKYGVKEIWYAISTLGLVQILQIIFLLWREVGGPLERYLPQSKTDPFYYMRFDSYIPFYYIALAFLLVAVLVNYRLRYSKIGYSMLALGSNEDAAESLGVDTRMTKLKGLLIYSFIVGAFGGFYACFCGFIQPKTDFNLDFSLEIVVLGIVGGLGTFYGPLLASTILVSLKEYLRSVFGTVILGIYPAIFGMAIILIILFKPEGLSSIFRNIYLRIKKTRG
ncbi:MAG: branched-chain amino acid ABC transporter permease [Candidatus Hadarchaeaceae archaeon]